MEPADSVNRIRAARPSWPVRAPDAAVPRPPKSLAPAAQSRHLAAVRRFGRVVSCARAMHDVLDVLGTFAHTDVTVTLLGETGSGKDVLANALHAESARAGGPFVVFDCGSVSPNLAESELLGHERGAFTGAVAAHAGAFERAQGGTLFLDEIAELRLDLQPRLLRALESRRVRRVGGKTEIPLDLRIVAATNCDLRGEVAAGRFREDLYFRLAAAVVHVPPLRERIDDLPLLVQVLLDGLGRPHARVSDAALAVLRGHAWPGNVRELKNALACAMAFLPPGADVLEPEHFRLLAPAPGQTSAIDRLPLAGHDLEALERAAVRQTLVQVEGNKIVAARRLGIAVSTLYKKLKQYGI